MPSLPSHRKALNPKQLFLLHLIFKFRFVSSKHIVKSLGLKTEKTIYRRLRNLHEQGYLDRKFDSSYKLSGKPAAYFLARPAIRYLKANSNLNDKALHNMYFSDRLKTPFIDHCLTVYDVFITFKQRYGTTMDFYTKSEAYNFENMPTMLPDGYIVLKRPNKANKEYFLDIFDDSLPHFTMTNKIKAYKKLHQKEAWDGDFPNLLFICNSPKLERRVQNTAARVFLSIENINVYTTSLKALLSSQAKTDPIWSDVNEPDRLLSF